jgi:hypothetical protein
MILKQVKDIAKQKSIKTVNMKKEDIIRTIQRDEGNVDCFGTAMSGFCDQYNCLWRTDCLK